jgi:hypothetical protein
MLDNNDNRKPTEEAKKSSELFHNIMKASVKGNPKPKKDKKK